MGTEPLIARRIVDPALEYLSATVSAEPDGSWVTTVKFSDGAIVSIRFPDEQRARQYPQQLATGLRQLRE